MRAYTAVHDACAPGLAAGARPLAKADLRRSCPELLGLESDEPQGAALGSQLPGVIDDPVGDLDAGYQGAMPAGSALISGGTPGVAFMALGCRSARRIVAMATTVASARIAAQPGSVSWPRRKSHPDRSMAGYLLASPSSAPRPGAVVVRSIHVHRKGGTPRALRPIWRRRSCSSAGVARPMRP